MWKFIHKKIISGKKDLIDSCIRLIKDNSDKNEIKCIDNFSRNVFNLIPLSKKKIKSPCNFTVSLANYFIIVKCVKEQNREMRLNSRLVFSVQQQYRSLSDNTNNFNNNSNYYKQNLSILSTNQIVERMQQYSKLNVPEAQLPDLVALLTEIADTRVKLLTVKTFRDAVHLAFISGSSELCLKIFYSRYDAHFRTDNQFTVYTVVVESAYRLGSVTDLQKIALICFSKLSISPREVISDFSLCRCFWRLICLSLDRSLPAQKQLKALEAAKVIWGEYIANNHITTSSNKPKTFITSPLDDEEGQLGARTDAPLPPSSSPFELNGKKINMTVVEAVQYTRHLMLYADPAEKGEMAFFRMCRDKGILRTSRRTSEELRLCETYYCGLIRTCKAGQFSEIAMEYFDELRALNSVNGTERGGKETDDSERQDDNNNVAQKAEDIDFSSPSLAEGEDRERGVKGKTIDKSDAKGDYEQQSTSDTATDEELTFIAASEGLAHSSLCHGSSGLTEVVLFSLLAVLQHAKDFRRVVEMGAVLLSDASNVLSPSVLATLCVAAGEVKDLEFAVRCFDLVVNHEVRPTPFIVYSCLSALSKCHVPDFEHGYLQQCLSRQLIDGDDTETITYLLLQNGLSSADPIATYRRIVPPLLAEEVGSDDGDIRGSNPTSGAGITSSKRTRAGKVISVRVASLCFKTLLRAESEEFLPFYRRIVHEFGLFKPVWVEELVLWADRRRYFLTQPDREFILQELRTAFNFTDAKEANLRGIGKLRTHIAIIQHDAVHNSLERFRATGWISPEPTMLDSRMHFIMKKRTAPSPSAASSTSPSSRVVDLESDKYLESLCRLHPGIMTRQRDLAVSLSLYNNNDNCNNNKVSGNGNKFDGNENDRISENEHRYYLLDLLHYGMQRQQHQ